MMDIHAEPQFTMPTEQSLPIGRDLKYFGGSGSIFEAACSVFHRSLDEAVRM